MLYVCVWNIMRCIELKHMRNIMRCIELKRMWNIMRCIELKRMIARWYFDAISNCTENFYFITVHVFRVIFKIAHILQTTRAFYLRNVNAVGFCPEGLNFYIYCYLYYCYAWKG